jgi:hypothetical protein
MINSIAQERIGNQKYSPGNKNSPEARMTATSSPLRSRAETKGKQEMYGRCGPLMASLNEGHRVATQHSTAQHSNRTTKEIYYIRNVLHKSDNKQNAYTLPPPLFTHLIARVFRYPSPSALVTERLPATLLMACAPKRLWSLTEGL